MNHAERIQPLGDRLIVKHLRPKPRASGLVLVRENPNLMDMIGDGDNGNHNDNRRVGVVSLVVSVGAGVRDIQKGDVIMHSAWNDLPESLDAPKDYAQIRMGDVFGHYYGSEYEA